MKNVQCLLILAVILLSTTLTAQEMKPVFEKEGDLIKGIFYYENGNISQEGTYKDGKLHGKWVSYNKSGKKTAIAYYRNGEKNGKWFFWSADVLTEVDYENNRITEVKSYQSTGSLVTGE